MLPPHATMCDFVVACSVTRNRRTTTTSCRHDRCRMHSPVVSRKQSSPATAKGEWPLVSSKYGPFYRSPGARTPVDTSLGQRRLELDRLKRDVRRRHADRSRVVLGGWKVWRERLDTRAKTEDKAGTAVASDDDVTSPCRPSPIVHSISEDSGTTSPTDDSHKQKAFEGPTSHHQPRKPSFNDDKIVEFDQSTRCPLVVSSTVNDIDIIENVDTLCSYPSETCIGSADVCQDLNGNATKTSGDDVISITIQEKGDAHDGNNDPLFNAHDTVFDEDKSDRKLSFSSQSSADRVVITGSDVTQAEWDKGKPHLWSYGQDMGSSVSDLGSSKEMLDSSISENGCGDFSKTSWHTVESDDSDLGSSKDDLSSRSSCNDTTVDFVSLDCDLDMAKVVSAEQQSSDSCELFQEHLDEREGADNAQSENADDTLGHISDLAEDTGDTFESVKETLGASEETLQSSDEETQSFRTPPESVSDKDDFSKGCGDDLLSSSISQDSWHDLDLPNKATPTALVPSTCSSHGSSSDTTPQISIRSQDSLEQCSSSKQAPKDSGMVETLESHAKDHDASSSDTLELDMTQLQQIHSSDSVATTSYAATEVDTSALRGDTSAASNDFINPCDVRVVIDTSPYIGGSSEGSNDFTNLEHAPNHDSLSCEGEDENVIPQNHHQGHDRSDLCEDNEASVNDEVETTSTDSDIVVKSDVLKSLSSLSDGALDVHDIVPGAPIYFRQHSTPSSNRKCYVYQDEDTISEEGATPTASSTPSLSSSSRESLASRKSRPLGRPAHSCLKTVTSALRRLPSPGKYLSSHRSVYDLQHAASTYFPACPASPQEGRKREPALPHLLTFTSISDLGSTSSLCSEPSSPATPFSSSSSQPMTPPCTPVSSPYAPAWSPLARRRKRKESNKTPPSPLLSSNSSLSLLSSSSSSLTLPFLSKRRGRSLSLDSRLAGVGQSSTLPRHSTKRTLGYAAGGEDCVDSSRMSTSSYVITGDSMPMLHEFDAKKVERTKQSNAGQGNKVKEEKKAQQFGLSLQEIKENTGRIIPRPVEDTIDYLKSVNADEIEGLFRRCARVSTMKEVQERYDDGETVDFCQYGDAHLAGAILKKFLRELSEPLMTFELFEPITRLHFLEQSKQVGEVQRILKDELPEDNYIILKHIFQFLQQVTNKSEVNLMTSANMATVFGPNIAWPKGQANLATVEQAVKFALILLENFDEVFLR